MFVVCGESLMDVFMTGDTATGVALDARVGGSPFNVAVGLARLGQRVSFLSSISSDFLGDRLWGALQREGVDTGLVQRVAAPTTLGLVGLDAQGVPAYAFYGERGADRQLDVSAMGPLPPDCAAIHVGSYATVVEPVASALCALVERERHRVTIACDPNVRLNVEPDLARWRARLHWLLQRAHVLKVSEEDLQLLAPGVATADFAAQALEHGVALVVVTRGAEGALGWTRAAHVHAAPQRVDVVDTVGAGDTFQAALLAWLAEHDALDAARLARLPVASLDAALAFGARAAALTCSRRGADLPRRAELAAFA